MRPFTAVEETCAFIWGQARQFLHIHIQILSKLLNNLRNFLMNTQWENFKRTTHNWFIPLSGSSIIQLLEIKEISNKKVDNRFVPTFVPNDLPRYERDGLMTQYEQVKYQEFLQNIGSHFQNLHILNFDIINSNGKIDVDKLKQYQTIDHHKIMAYPPEIREQIMSSIFRAKRPGMYIKK